MGTINRFKQARTLFLMLPALLAGCASLKPHPAAPPATGDPTALTITAEAALKRGDCRVAAEDYARAATTGDARLARRATEVALACEHLPAAWEAATRWRTLAPEDRDANALYALVALKLYRTADARVAVRDYCRAALAASTSASTPASAPASTPANTPADAPRRSRPGRDQGVRALGDLIALLLEETDAAAVLTTMSAVPEPTAKEPQALAMFGELALAAYDGKRAEDFAQQALARDPKDFAALRVLARAQVLRGDATRAIATARSAAAVDAVRGGLELAEVLASLDRVEEAHQQLESLRAGAVPAGEIERRLALLAFQSGDLKEAQRRFAALLTSGEGNEAAQLYLADIAARDGDPERAIAEYRRLYDSSVAVPARSRAAALLLERTARADSARTEALTLLDDYAAEHPEEELRLTLAKAHLLADHGDADASLKVLATALERHPQHPSIEYDRAVILDQAGHVHESVSALEQLLAQRPDDPSLQNALGYTLADHSLELPRAEGLIRRALTVMPDSPAALDSLGWVHFRRGDARSAAGTLERAYSIDHDAEIAAHWGEALWVSGVQGEARKVWAAALAREPQSRPLKATLERLIPDAK
ncbi:MAG TPA: tetratricopeptide repeat protein [Steroidobacteraceae bacterium]|nr:tetratricopeptide repeat protein [Steroidobacteraceae bacterium]